MDKNLKSKLQILFDEAASEHKYGEAATILSWIYECDDTIRLMRYCGSAAMSIPVIFTALYTAPFWMRMRHYYLPYNKSQLEFRRVVLMLSMEPDVKSPYPKVSGCLLQSIGIYAIYNEVKKRCFGRQSA